MSDTFPPQSTRRHPPSPDGDDTPRIWTGRDSTPTPPPASPSTPPARASRAPAHPDDRWRPPSRSLTRSARAPRPRCAARTTKKFTRAARPRRRRASRARSWCVRIDATERERMDRRCDAWGKRNARERERGTTRTRERAWGTRARIILARDHRETARTRRRARGWMDARVWDRVGSRARYPRAIGTRDRGSRTRARGGGVGENASSHARGWPGRARRDGRGRGARGRRRRVKGRSVSRDA